MASTKSVNQSIILSTAKNDVIATKLDFLYCLACEILSKQLLDGVHFAIQDGGPKSFPFKWKHYFFVSERSEPVLARFCPPGRNRAAEILSARAAEIPFSPSFSPMGRNCLKLFTYTALLYALAVDGDFLHFAISYISWLIHQLAYAQSMCRVSSVWLHH